MATLLDEELAEIIRPLVGLNAHVSVSPHVNTLCLAYHYRLAHENHAGADDRIKLIDWNLNPNDPRFLPTLTGNVDGLHMFYSTKEVAATLKGYRGRDHFYNSVAVTRYRQRLVFLRRNASNEAFVREFEGKHISDIAIALLTDGSTGRKPYIITDIRDQARAVVRTALKDGSMPPILYPQSPLGNSPNDDFALFVYSGPSTEYMARRDDHFIPLNIDQLPTLQDDAYETHIVWFMPPNTSDETGITITRCLRTYHERLFEAAQRGNDADFQGMGDAIGLALTARHPSFRSVVFRCAADFRQCLLNHHSDP